MEYFVSVAHHASFSRAAEEHFISQTTMSYHISLLERELGVELFDRRGKAVVLTPAGESYLPRATEVLRTLGVASKEARLVQEGASGELRIGYFGHSCYDLIPSALDQLVSAEPSARLWVHQAPQSELVRMLQANELDCIFCTDYGRFSRLDRVQRMGVYADPICLLVRCDHWAAARSSVRVEELANERFALYAEKTLWEQDAADFPIRCREVQYVDSHDDLVLMVRSGYAVSAGARRALAGAHEDLRLVPFEDYHQFDNNYLCWNTGDSKELLHRFIQIVEDCSQRCADSGAGVSL